MRLYLLMMVWSVYFSALFGMNKNGSQLEFCPTRKGYSQLAAAKRNDATAQCFFCDQDSLKTNHILEENPEKNVRVMMNKSPYPDQVTKVIVPMAGLGTRLLPLTKAGSKSMVPLIDKPALHYVVDEGLQSGLTDFCFIINEDERGAIEHYFSFDYALDVVLAERKKEYFLQPLNDLISRSYFTYIAQPEPLGLGHAVLMGESFIEPGEFFCVMLPDNIIESNDPHMARLIAIAQQYNASVITVEEITSQQASQYAIVTPKEFLSDDLVEIVDIVEKPQSWNSGIVLAQMGRHVFSYDIFESLKAIEPGVAGELQLTDAVRHMLRNGKRVFAYKLHGKRYDIGNIRGLLGATVSLALHNPLYKDMVCAIFKQEMVI